MYIFTFHCLQVLTVTQGVTETKTKGGKGLLLFQDDQGCNDRLLPSSSALKEIISQTDSYLDILF